MMKITLFICFIFGTVICFAQGPSGPPATPIDGGLSLLLAGGIAYGANKLRKLNKNKA